MGKERKREPVVILTAAAAAVAVILIFFAVGTKLLAGQETVQAVAARTYIKKGTKITEQNLKELTTVVQVEKGVVPNTAVTDISILSGKVLKDSVEPKQMILQTDLTDKKMASEGMHNPMELTFSASSVADSVGGIIRSGDLIHVGVTVREKDGSVCYKLAGENVYVVEALDENGNPVEEKDGGMCTMFRVLMDQKDAERMMETIRGADSTIVMLPER